MTIAATDIQANEHYLRFGFGLDHPESTYFHDEYCSISKPLLYSCEPGFDGFPVRRSVGNFGNMPVVEFGIGYPNGRSRWELLIEYRPSFSFSGNATYGDGSYEQVASAKNISSLAGMVAGYIDFSGNGNAVPFVGAGLGIAQNRMKEFQIRFPSTTTILPGAKKTNLAWMITAGIGFKLDKNQTLDLSWHYTDLGLLYTGPNGRNYCNRPNERLGCDYPGQLRRPLTHIPTVAELKGHGIRLSLRIKI